MLHQAVLRAQAEAEQVEAVYRMFRVSLHKPDYLFQFLAALLLTAAAQVEAKKLEAQGCFIRTVGQQGLKARNISGIEVLAFIERLEGLNPSVKVHFQASSMIALCRDAHST